MARFNFKRILDRIHSKLWCTDTELNKKNYRQLMCDFVDDHNDGIYVVYCSTTGELIGYTVYIGWVTMNLNYGEMAYPFEVSVNEIYENYNQYRNAKPSKTEKNG